MLTLGLLTAACGGSGGSGGNRVSAGGPETSGTPGTGTASSAPASTEATGTSSAGTACATSALDVTLGETGAAAGTTYRHLDFRNRTSQPCTLTGYPGVSFADSAGNRVGYPAERNPAKAPATVTIGPGQYAHAVLGVPDSANFPSDKCHPRTTANLRVYPPNQRASALVSYQQTVCTSAAGRATITAVTAGR